MFYKLVCHIRGRTCFENDKLVHLKRSQIRVNPGHKASQITVSCIQIINQVPHVEKVLNKHIPATHFPYWMGMAGGYCLDLLAKVTGKKLPISSVRVKKFCATTEFNADKMLASGFIPPYSLQEGLARTLEFEFLHPRPDDITFKSE